MSNRFIKKKMYRILANQLLNFYWVNSIVNNGKRKYFDKIFLPNLLNSLNSEFEISKYFDLKYAFEQSSVKGLINTIFDPNEEFFSVLDLSVSINIAVNGYCNNEYVYNDKIIDSANYICENLKRRLYDDKVLKTYLADINKDLNNFSYEVSRSEIESVLTNKSSIFKTYFRKYHNPNYSTGIRIYHQAEGKNWIDWNDENSIQISHNTIEFREGFFLIGFDYQLSTGEYLRIATLKDGVEYFNPSKYSRDNVIWAM